MKYCKKCTGRIFTSINDKAQFNICTCEPNDSKPVETMIKKLPKHEVEVRVTEQHPIGNGFSSHRELKEVVLLDDLLKGLRDL